MSSTNESNQLVLNLLFEINKEEPIFITTLLKFSKTLFFHKIDLISTDLSSSIPKFE